MKEQRTLLDTRIEVAKPESGSLEIGLHLVVKRTFKQSNTLVFDLNRNLDMIEAKTIFDYTKQFLRNAEGDFQLLAQALQVVPEFRNVTMIYGISVFPDSLGRRFGFQSQIYSTNPRLIAKFLERTPKKALLGNAYGTKALRKFTIDRGEFLAKYYAVS